MFCLITLKSKSRSGVFPTQVILTNSISPFSISKRRHVYPPPQARLTTNGSGWLFVGIVHMHVMTIHKRNGGKEHWIIDFRGPHESGRKQMLIRVFA
ncbi:hypothetical protein CEXT_472071 [Caerostris extrusa]|uniref:Uncharacterized protein n=1 Tax=Caerostris extrusa TaxID=172846 RepID=A0AAV4W1G6_CAEEX|nr:hypothetical protein CEXT_472071 [Caerostris extrusa]